MRTAKLSRNTNKIVNSERNKNYWSPLTFPVEEQEQPTNKQELQLQAKKQTHNITEQERRQIGATCATKVEK